MFRYIGLIWNPADPTQSELVGQLPDRLKHSLSRWQASLTKDGLRIYVSGVRRGASEPHILHNNSGVVLGTVFERNTDGAGIPRHAVFSDAESEDIAASKGRRLVEQYWGQYVAFVSNRPAGGAQVLRSPVAALPCYFVQHRGVFVFFSDITDCEELGIAQFTINWRYVAAHLFAGSLPPNEATALNEVSSLRPGECMDINREHVNRLFYWNPLHIAASGVIEDPASAVESLRRTTRECVYAWASGHRNIIHRLSGGIDSNIVLSCLHDAPTRPNVTCLNYYSEGSDTDERTLARAGARRAACKLIERRRNSELRLESIFKIAKTPEPHYYIGQLENSRLEAQLATENHANAIFSGGGGDTLYYEARATFAPGDFVYRHGIRPALLRIAYDAARLERMSLSHLLRKSIADGLMRRTWNPLKERGGRRPFQNQELFSGSDEFMRHPWFEQTENIPNGKRWHAYGLSFPFIFYDPFGLEDDPEQIHPLMSQPLIELALRIPTYVLTLEGWGRSIARRAFAKSVPHEIIWRRTKGGMEEHMKAILVLNLKFIREVVLDGMLVQHGLLNRTQLEDFFSLRPAASSGLGGGMHAVMEYLNVEAWLRRMSATQRAAAA